MGKLEGKVAVITGGSSGLALASAKRFVEEGAYVFITGRRQEALDEAVRLIGRKVTGVRGDASNLDDLDRLFDTVKREKGKIDVLFASAGKGEAAKLGEITEQHFDAGFDLIVRGTLFTVRSKREITNTPMLPYSRKRIANTVHNFVFFNHGRVALSEEPKTNTRECSLKT
jgi:NAD(P)-dependent dehydrogenase (short-subunit alcohol dehydrogenase family)